MTAFHAVAATDERFVWLAGELDACGVDDFLQVVSGCVEAGGPVVIDVTRLTMIDSDGIRSLLSIARRLRGRGCLILHNPTAHVAKVLDIVGLSHVPDVHILDARHAELVPDGPGAWGRSAAFRRLASETDDRLERARDTAHRAAVLGSRTRHLVRELHDTRQSAAARHAAPVP